MSLEERLEQAEKLVAEVKAELAAMRATKASNWPERIEAGMCFRWGKGLTYIYVQGGTLANIESGETFDAHLGFNGRERDFTYLGHARDILAIRTGAHEPTGAELVGRMCEFADLMSGPWSPGECAAFGQNPAYPYRKAGGAEWKYARLAK